VACRKEAAAAAAAAWAAGGWLQAVCRAGYDAVVIHGCILYIKKLQTRLQALASKSA
jgi:hypothetical protein